MELCAPETNGEIQHKFPSIGKKHAWLYSDLLQALKGELLTGLRA